MSNTSTLLMVTSDGMGTADPALRHELLAKYLTLLDENGTPPGAIAFYAEGVRMVVEGSPVLEQLATLEAAGVHLVACQTCLNHLGLADAVRVGVVGGMGDILAAQLTAQKVVTL